jgi:DNA-binding NarL/FixJ family response regulator
MELVATPRVLLADDHQSMLERTSAILHEFEVIGTVHNGRDAIAEVQRLDPDVLVIDISMPIIDGLQAAFQLQSIRCRTKVIFLTVHEDKDFIAAAFSVGASGYVAKSRMSLDLVPAIREVLQGHTYVSQSIPRRSR